MLSIKMLGRPLILLDEEPVTGFISSKSAALLFFLAATGQTHSRDKLAGLLWGEFTEQKARKNLRDVLSNLRSILKPYIMITRQDVSLNHNSPLLLDVEKFNSAMQDVEPLRGGYLSPVATAVLREALDLYQGDFLDEFQIPNAPDFELWLVAERTRYQNLTIKALRLLIDYATSQGNTTIGLKYATQLLIFEPWHEETHRQIMKLLVWSGQRSAALAQFETCRRTLAEQYRAEPEFETRQLYERILRGDLILAEPARDSDANSVKYIYNNLPAQLTNFVGREAEVAEMIERLHDPHCRLLTIIGPGGVGKTRLALQSARLLFENQETEPIFLDGIFLVNLASMEAAVSDKKVYHADGYIPIAAAIADALNLSLQDPEAPASRIANYLREKQMLLVIDNFEHLLFLANYLAKLLEVAPGLKMLVTSRSRLNLRGEQVFILEGLPFPQEVVDHASWHDYSAVQLFVQTAQLIDNEFNLEPEEEAAVRRICQLVDGLPLGIELAATWVRVLSCTEIMNELEKNLRFLNAAMRDMPERHRSLWAVFTYSWNMQTAAEQKVLRQLSVFRGGFDREGAQIVAEASLPDLLRLVDSSFIRRTGGQKSKLRFEMLEVVRSYVAEQLQQNPTEGTLVFDRHCHFYLDFLQSFAEELQGQNQRAALDAISVEFENIRAAWRWTVYQGDTSSLDKGLPSLFDYYDMRSRFQEGLDAFRRAAEVVAEVLAESEEIKVLLARLKARQGWFSFHVGKYVPAKSLLEQSVALLRPLHAPEDLVFSLNYLSAVYFHLGIDAQAEKTCQEALQLSQEIDYPVGEGISLNILSQIAYRAGDYEAAQDYGQKSLRIVTDLGNPWSKAFSLSNLAQVAFASQDYEAVREFSQEILAIRQEMGDLRGKAMCLEMLARTAVAQEADDEAMTLYQHSLALYREIGNQRGMISSLVGQADIAQRQGNDALARDCYADALKRAVALKNLPDLPQIVAGLSEVLQRLGELDTAEQLEKILKLDAPDKKLGIMVELL